MFVSNEVDAQYHRPLDGTKTAPHLMNILQRYRLHESIIDLLEPYRITSVG